MNIIIVCPRTPRKNSAGIENSVIHISKVLKENNHSVSIYTTSPNPKKKSSINNIKINEYVAFAPNDNYFLSLPLYFALKKANADLLFLNGFNNLTTLTGLLTKKKNQKAIIIMNSSQTSSLFRRLLWIPYTFLFSILSNRLDKIICVSEYEKEAFQKKLRIDKRKFTVIRNGVDLDFINSIKINQKENSIVMLGRIVKHKGFQYVIKSLPIILKTLPEIKLKIIGSGPYKKTLKKMVYDLNIEHAVIFKQNIPFSNRTELIKEIKKSKIFISLSDYESQGIVAWEALACKLPVILSNKTAFKEIIKSKVAIGINNPKNRIEISEKIIKVLVNPNNYIKTVKIDSWQNIGVAVLKVINNTTSSN